MLRALEALHICRLNEVLRLLHIPVTYRSTPTWPTIMTVWLEDILLQFEVRINRTTNIANRHGEDTLPSSSLRAGIRPSIGDSILGTLTRSVGVVIVTSGVVGIQRRVDDVLHRDSAVIALVKLVGTRWRRDPSPLMRCGGDDIVLLPVVQVPGLAVTANRCFLGTGANTLVVAACAAAHDEDLLRAI